MCDIPLEQLRNPCFTWKQSLSMKKRKSSQSFSTGKKKEMKGHYNYGLYRKPLWRNSLRKINVNCPGVPNPYPWIFKLAVFAAECGSKRPADTPWIIIPFERMLVVCPPDEPGWLRTALTKICGKEPHRMLCTWRARGLSESSRARDEAGPLLPVAVWTWSTPVTAVSVTVLISCSKFS